MLKFTMDSKVSIVWLKRDIRTLDHEALKQVEEDNSNVIVIYIFEPLIENYGDFDIRHWRFVYQSLIEFNSKIPITVFHCDAKNAFSYLLQKYKVKQVLSYQETGLEHTFDRDIKIKHLLKHHEVKWKEFQSNGVLRGIKNRTSWDARWIKSAKKEIPTIDTSQVSRQTIQLKDHPFLLSTELRATLSAPNKNMLTGGESQAHKMLNDFLETKIGSYFNNISYPEKSRYYCSLLSAYISWGNITISQIYQACENARPKIKNKMSIDQYMARLKWHCHFTQKLEMQTNIEYKNLNPAFDHLRHKKNKNFVKAWKNGETGYPLVDACMRAVKETGYINFRMRAMVVSFFTHHLWQPWQEGANYLARMFLDYEPGIHYSQFQMQAGTTGINIIRIYNPIKQSYSKDPRGEFIKKWLPELKSIPNELVHEPWKLSPLEESLYDFKLGIDYPKPIVDIEQTGKYAREELYKAKNSEQSRYHGKDILIKHAKKRNAKRLGKGSKRK